MKKLYILLTAILIASSLFAQVPQKMSYQAVVRNADNSLVTNTSIGMQVSILQGSTDGTAVYVERHTTSTNANGLVTIEVGTGTVVSGNFASIDWANGPYYFKTESDPAGGTSYTISGTSQLLSVPYALHAQTANELSGGVTETDPVFTAWDKSSGILISVNQVTDLENYADTLSQHFNFESVQNGDLLMYNGTQWVKFTPSYLTSFTESDPTVAANFSFAGAATGDLLQFDGTKWVKLTPTYLSSYTETDPVFAEWDKSSGISVTESQISDLKSYLTAITGESIGDLNDVDLTGIGADKILKYNAAAQKWIIAEAAGTTETDPIFSAWDKSSGITVTENQISDLGSYLETEADPAFSGNFSIANPNAGEVLRYDGTHFVNASQQTLSVDGDQLSISDGNSITLPTGSAASPSIPILTTSEIVGLTPEAGDAVFNSTENLYQIYTGSAWVSLPATCWPQPTPANAGSDQYFSDGTTSTTLSGNAPEVGHGTGQWSIISGEGGSFDDDTNPNTSFTGMLKQTYELQWSITTNCNISSDNLIIIFLGSEPGNGVSDIDGNEYSTIIINNQEWMAENLKVTKYNNGDPIPTNLNDAEWTSTNEGAYAIYPYSQIDGLGSDSEVLIAFGALYNFHAVQDTRGICPTGWHVPTGEEWNNLIDFAGGINFAGGNLKSTRTEPDTHPRWDSPNEGAVDMYNFSALPGGERDGDGPIFGLGAWGCWWSSTIVNSTPPVPLHHVIFNNNEIIDSPPASYWDGFSIRCIKD